VVTSSLPRTCTICTDLPFSHGSVSALGGRFSGDVTHDGREHGGRETPDSESKRECDFSNGSRCQRALDRAVLPKIPGSTLCHTLWLTRGDETLATRGHWLGRVAALATVGITG